MSRTLEKCVILYAIIVVPICVYCVAHEYCYIFFIFKNISASPAIFTLTLVQN